MLEVQTDDDTETDLSVSVEIMVKVSISAKLYANSTLEFFILKDTQYMNS